jgi:hypothetical protein
MGCSSLIEPLARLQDATAFQGMCRPPGADSLRSLQRVRGYPFRSKNGSRGKNSGSGNHRGMSKSAPFKRRRVRRPKIPGQTLVRPLPRATPFFRYSTHPKYRFPQRCLIVYSAGVRWRTVAGVTDGPSPCQIRSHPRTIERDQSTQTEQPGAGGTPCSGPETFG